MSDDYRAAAYACRSILVKLAQISDAPTAKLRADASASPKSAESRIPEGVRLNGTPTNCDSAPSKQFSLWGHYSYRMTRAAERKDASTLLKLAACATRDYEVYTRTRPGFHANHEAAVTELLRDCVGVPALEAAWYLGAPVEWVRRQRIINGRDPEYGEPRDKIDGLTTQILSLAEAGKSVRMIAGEVHMSKSAVQRIIARAGSVSQAA